MLKEASPRADSKGDSQSITEWSRSNEQEHDRTEIFPGSHRVLLVMKHTTPPFRFATILCLNAKHREWISWLNSMIWHNRREPCLCDTQNIAVLCCTSIWMKIWARMSSSSLSVDWTGCWGRGWYAPDWSLLQTFPGFLLFGGSLSARWRYQVNVHKRGEQN